MTQPETIIRHATPADAASLGNLGAQLVRVHHEYDRARFIPPTDDTARGYGGFLASQTQEPDAMVLVAEREGSVIGYAFGSVEGMDWMALRGPAGVLHDIVVSESARGTGIGTQLLRAMLAELKSRGVPRIVLSTAAKNDGSRRLFEDAGFRETMVEMTMESE